MLERVQASRDLLDIEATVTAIEVIAQADDSSGIIGDGCRRLLGPPPKGSSCRQGVYKRSRAVRDE